MTDQVLDTGPVNLVQATATIKVAVIANKGTKGDKGDPGISAVADAYAAGLTTAPTIDALVTTLQDPAKSAADLATIAAAQAATQTAAALAATVGAQEVVDASPAIMAAKDAAVAAATAAGASQQTVSQAAAAIAPLGSQIRTLVVEAGGAGTWRARIGNRLYLTLEPTRGFWPRKMTIPSTAMVDDDLSNGLLTRLVGAGVGNFFKRPAAEASAGMVRWRIGSRLLATLDVVSGFYPRRLTIPAGATIDDDLASPIVSRLVKDPTVIGMLKRLGGENTGGVLRFRIGNRLMGSWSAVTGMAFTRMTLPADAKMADLPTVNLVDRLGGGGAAVTNGSYVVTAATDPNSKLQIYSMRVSDGQVFQISPGSTVFRAPSITADSKVIFYSDADRRSYYAPIEGGAIWPVLPDLALDAWGDSLTAGLGIVGSGPGVGSYPKQLGDRLSSHISAVNNRGVPGQISAEIEARHGGAPALISVTGNQIPASGAVIVTSYNLDLLLSSNFSGYLTLTGTLAGVPGTLSGSGTTGRGTSVYTFTRATAGSAVACSANTPFLPDLGAATRPRINLRVYGRNDAASSSGKATILAALASADAWNTAYARRNLTGSVLRQATGEATATLARIDDINATLATTYGNTYVDLNSAPTINEMAVIGFVPDSYGAYANGQTDAADISGGFIPSGMRLGTVNGPADWLHLNSFGYALWALRFYRKIYALNWFPGLPAA